MAHKSFMVPDPLGSIDLRTIKDSVSQPLLASYQPLPASENISETATFSNIEVPAPLPQGLDQQANSISANFTPISHGFPALRPNGSLTTSPQSILQGHFQPKSEIFSRVHPQRNDDKLSTAYQNHSKTNSLCSSHHKLSGVDSLDENDEVLKSIRHPTITQCPTLSGGNVPDQKVIVYL